MSKIRLDFINNLLRYEIVASIYLINGIRLQGKIVKVGEDSLVLKREKDQKEQLVCMSAISTISEQEKNDTVGVL